MAVYVQFSWDKIFIETIYFVKQMFRNQFSTCKQWGETVQYYIATFVYTVTR